MKCICLCGINNLCQFIFIYLTCVATTNVRHVPRPRGVSLSRSSLYSGRSTFTCLDGSLTIPFDQVNDDYCDCRDGTDEPGTPACPNGVFQCNNIGHVPKNIPSSRVNDGICDCCDGSDEYQRMGLCEDTCSVLGKAARLEYEKQVARMKEGSEIRQQLIGKGKELHQAKEARLEELENEHVESERSKQLLEEAKINAEEAEKAALDVYRELEEIERKKREEEERIKDEQEGELLFRAIDTNANGGIDEKEVRNYANTKFLDTDGDGQISDDEAEILLPMGQNHVELKPFLSDGTWLKIKEIMKTKPLVKAPANELEDDLDRGEKYDEEAEAGNEEVGDDNADVDDSVDDEETADAEDMEAEDENVRDTENENIATKSEDSQEKYDEHTKLLIQEANDARAKYDEAVRTTGDLEREIRQLKDKINRDYGRFNEYATLDGECYEHRSREYVYKLCPFDQVSQQPLQGGSETKLGVWSGWQDDSYSAMKFTNGQVCWNGPARQTTVQLFCGLDHEVTHVSEPNRCEYLMRFETPAACASIPGEPLFADASHDEL